MQFGICTSIENAAAVKEAGWDYVEANAQALFQGLIDEEQWTSLAKVRSAPLPVLAANSLVPGSLKITGPQADPDRLGQYMSRVIARAAQCRTQTLVFGSGDARRVPDGFDRQAARQQIVQFARMSAELAAPHGITIVAEHLNRGECNIINSVAEAMEYVRAVDHPNFRCLVDSYHLWLEDEPIENLIAALPWIRHVHVADKQGRVPPGQSGKADYRPLFAALKQAGYDRTISVEASGFSNILGLGPRVLEYLRKQWTAS
jgi:sugar phosphate isomerase/epimerase